MNPIMTPKERAVAALTLKVPDMVPTFELDFQLGIEMFGKDLLPRDLLLENISKLSAADKDKRLNQLAEDMVYVYDELEYSIIPIPLGIGIVDDSYISPELCFLLKKLNQLTKGNKMLSYHADGTYSLPDGDEMYDFAYSIADDPESVHKEARRMADAAVIRNEILLDAGVEVGIMCCDYCYNSGPFISPTMFSEFIQPYLAKIIYEGKKRGMYMIKHCDGNIMPILDMMVDCEPHALHSIDPMAGVDIKEVKAFVGHKVALCGNVHCAALQTGTDEEIIASAEYCMTHAKPNGGYIFCTSNIPFKGMPPERYTMILDVWKKMRAY